MHQLLCYKCGGIAERTLKIAKVTCYRCKKKGAVLRAQKMLREGGEEMKKLRMRMAKSKERKQEPTKYRKHPTDGMSIREKHEYFMELQRKEKENEKSSTR